jgi:hypothetical protein
MASIGSYTMVGWDGHLFDPELRHTVLEPSPGQDGAVVLFGGYEYRRNELKTVSVHASSAAAQAALALYRALQATGTTIIDPSGRTWTSCVVLSALSAPPFCSALGTWQISTTWQILVPLQA